MRELRDHSMPCEHAPDSTHPLYRLGHTQDGGWCVGGRLVRLREALWCDTHSCLATSADGPECGLVEMAPTPWVEEVDGE